MPFSAARSTALPRPLLPIALLPSQTRLNTPTRADRITLHNMKKYEKTELRGATMFSNQMLQGGCHPVGWCPAGARRACEGRVMRGMAWSMVDGMRRHGAVIALHGMAWHGMAWHGAMACHGAAPEHSRLLPAPAHAAQCTGSRRSSLTSCSRSRMSHELE